MEGQGAGSMNMLLQTLLISVTLTLLLACDSTAPVNTTPTTTSQYVGDGFRGSVPINYDVYANMLRIGDESLGYALYTYVLTPNQAEAGSHIDIRYKQLRHEITSTTLTEKASAYFPKRESNIFYLPGGSAYQRHTLSLQLISHLHSRSHDKIKELLPISSPGPFLVSIQHPMLGMNKHTNLLIADLSSTNKSAFPEVIAAYKQRLKHDGIKDIEYFESLRLSLLNHIFNVNDNLHLVRNALADWQ